LFHLTITTLLFAQDAADNSKPEQEISALIDNYTQARENGDTVLLNQI